ncbi:hypothetical protein [Streptomyces microflavus]|uniref:hypothetical protein n=1 Tax=Streptomyces microflavus TaxID=1919 RepID=UPI0037FD0C75
MATYSHECARCGTESPRTADYGDALEAQAYHRDQLHGGHVPRQGDRIITHPTGWSDATTGERWAMVAALAFLAVLVARIL